MLALHLSASGLLAGSSRPAPLVANRAAIKAQAVAEAPVQAPPEGFYWGFDSTDPGAAIAEAPVTPLFRKDNGQALRGAEMHATVQRLMRLIGECPRKYGSHSLRIGGATALADAGCSDVIIMTMGRWSSNCFRVYCRAARKSLLHWASQIGNHDTMVVEKQQGKFMVPVRYS